MTTNTDKLAALPFAVFDEFGNGCDDRIQDHISAALEAAGRVQAEPAVIVTVSKEGSTTTTDIKWRRTFFEGDTPLYLAAPTAQEASKPVQAEAPSETFPPPATVNRYCQAGMCVETDAKHESYCYRQAAQGEAK